LLRVSCVMAETLLQFQAPVIGPNGVAYRARACGVGTAYGTWQGWIEFDPIDRPAGSGTLRTPRETTQPNRADTVYWATGLTQVYLEGALQRALVPPVRRSAALVEDPVFEGPAPSAPSVHPAEPARASAILDPFSVYEKGEALLRQQLAALSPRHLVNIILDYELSTEHAALLNREPAALLIERIVAAVQPRPLKRS
jgi:hypothetical protein